PGTYDDDAHASYLAASASLRAKAERRAAMVRLLKAVGSEVSWGDRLRLVRAKFGTEGTDKRTLQRYLNTVEGVDPINYAPALLPGHKGSPVRASTSNDAWRCFMTIIRDASKDFPLIQAWRDVRDIAAQKGWDWPSYATVFRRWSALTPAQQLTARLGREEASKRAGAIGIARQAGDPRAGLGFAGQPGAGLLGRFRRWARGAACHAGSH
ncbi:DNA-binding domain-containing protein, partial [Roseovarius dicentrarchi]|uniref:DNA-binding domain-containing protein n=1 Tax=Roseovarius dicentrarchi TaxID=2250573 RepID=UPI00139672C1